ncbi:hypothetical protein LLH23_23660 [bacterium]|nr:hypothetical protein [bacterium]
MSARHGSSARHFALFEHGPLSGLARRARLTGPGRPGHPRLWLALIALAWLPLVVLSLVAGKAYGAVAGATVLSDWGMTGRLLIGMPVLIAVQTSFDRHLAWVDGCFRSAGLLGPDETARFDQAIAATARLAASTAAELVIVVLAFAQSTFLVYEGAAHSGLQWVFAEGRGVLSLPGWWAVTVALPLSTLVSLRWLWRLLLWWRFCWRVSRLHLRIMPSHPDGAGGLDFLNISLTVFAFAGAGMLASLAGHFATRILATGAGIADLRLQLLGALLGTLVIFAGPLLLFSPCLARAKLAGISAYGALVCQQGHAFEARWLLPDAGNAESLAQNDFSARTDLNSVAQLVYNMRTTVFRTKHLLILVGGAALPFVPVVFLLLPAREIFRGLVGLLL